MIIGVVAVVGLLWGSFANVLIARVPAGEGWIVEPSRCPRCRTRIKWYDNLPVVSWLLLRRKCRSCRAPISSRYPVVELAVAGAFVLVYLTWGLTILSLAFAYLALVSVVLVAIDLDVQRLPDSIVLPSLLVGLVLLAAATIIDGTIWDLARAGLGALILAGFYGLLWFIYPQGMGLGDVKTAALLGLYGGILNWTHLAVVGIAGPMLGGLAVLAGLVTGRLTRRSRVPYGPALIGGAWVGYVWGEAIATWWIELLV